PMASRTPILRVCRLGAYAGHHRGLRRDVQLRGPANPRNRRSAGHWGDPRSHRGDDCEARLEALTIRHRAGPDWRFLCCALALAPNLECVSHRPTLLRRGFLDTAAGWNSGLCLACLARGEDRSDGGPAI